MGDMLLGATQLFSQVLFEFLLRTFATFDVSVVVLLRVLLGVAYILLNCVLFACDYIGKALVVYFPCFLLRKL